MRCRILIAFYSRGGAVEALAGAIAEGAEAAGAEVRLRRARELVGPEVMARAPGWAEAAARMNGLHEAPTLEDAEWCDGLILGSPTRFGGVAANCAPIWKASARSGCRTSWWTRPARRSPPPARRTAARRPRSCRSIRPWRTWAW